jgi:transcriptional regulator with XRE-family HTH domain
VKNIQVGAQRNLGRLVHELRARAGLTQEKLAARLGVTFPTINRWENRRTRPSPLGLRQIETMLREMGDQGRDLLENYVGDRELKQPYDGAGR